MIKESVWTIGDVNPKCPFKWFQFFYLMYEVVNSYLKLKVQVA